MIFSPTRNRAVVRFAAAAWIMLAASGSAIADSTTEGPQQGPAQAFPPQEVDAIQAPTIDETSLGAATSPTQAELFYRALPPIGASDKATIYTDMGLGLPATSPTALEQAKLDMARAAVDRARAAGTLFISPSVDAHSDPSAEATQAKLNILRTTPPAQLSPDPAAGAGVEVAPVQLVGPPEMTPAEIQKIADVEKNGGGR